MGSKGLLALIVVAVGLGVSGRWSRAPSSAVDPAAPVIVVAGGIDLQTALDQARPGQTIVLTSGQTYEGPFVLPDKSGEGWITVRGAQATTSPNRRAGQRVSPKDAADMPKLESATGAVISAAPGAHNYRLIGLEVAPAAGVFLEEVISLGTGVADAASIPHDFVLQQLYVHGDSVRGSRRGLALNSATTTVSDSYFADFKEQGNDSQAICGWSRPGPFVVVDNYLEAAGENLMFGGADPPIAGMVPSDIQITNNDLQKNVDWRALANAGGPTWSVKNLLELKNARRVTIDGNRLEYTWTAGQVGFGVLFTPRNQDGRAPWSVVEDVTFSNNVVRHVAAGIHVLGHDDIHQSQPLHDIRIVNNLFEDVGGSWGAGRLFQLIDGTTNVTIDHNTGLQTDAAVVGGDTGPHVGFVFTNNIVNGLPYGIVGSDTAPGLASIARYFQGSTIRRNAFIQGAAATYPPDNFFPLTISSVGFLDAIAEGFALDPTSPLKGKGTDGRDVGADVSLLPIVGGEVRARPRAGVFAAPAVQPQIPTIAELVFWGSILLIGYVYAGYPIVLWIAGRLSPMPIHRAPWYPSITVLIVAYNEEARIRQRIANIRSCRYPAAELVIVVVSDGSTDGTVAEARAASPRVEVIAQPERRGKAAAFNAVLPSLTSEIVVLADARQRFAPDALEALVANLADGDVGAVSGQLILGTDSETSTAAQGAGAYWRYETCIRRWESVVGSTVGATGAITAIRRSLFEQIPTDTVLDDLLIPMRIARRGYRIAFEPRARAYDGLPASGRDEFARKVRTLAGNFQILSRERWLWRPSTNRLWLQTMSHKALRLALPILFVLTLTSNVVLASTAPGYRATLVLQIVFYLIALLAGVWPGLRRRTRWAIVPYTICFMSCATVLAFLRFLLGRQSVTWERASISEPA